MSNKDNESKNSQQLFSEDITKRLVKKILDENPDEETEIKEQQPTEKKSDFNIEYEEYDHKEFENTPDDFAQDDYYEEEYNEYEEYDDYDDYDDYEPRQPRRPHSSNVREFKRSPRNHSVQNNTRSNYRKNIERYGKEFFEDDYDDYDDNQPSLVGKVISFSIILVLTISTAFLAFSLITTKKDLKEANAKVEELLDSKQATENKITEDALKQENDALKQENEDLKAQLNPNGETNNNQSNNKPSSNNGNSSNNSGSSSYTVKQGDTIWKISQNVYGNGAHFQKILDANGLKENSVLTPGQKLTIPKIN